MVEGGGGGGGGLRAVALHPSMSFNVRIVVNRLGCILFDQSNEKIGKLI